MKCIKYYPPIIHNLDVDSLPGTSVGGGSLDSASVVGSGDPDPEEVVTLVDPVVAASVVGSGDPDPEEVVTFVDPVTHISQLRTSGTTPKASRHDTMVPLSSAETGSTALDVIELPRIKTL